MSDTPHEPDPKADPTLDDPTLDGKRAPTPRELELAQLSPVRSMAAVSFTFLLFTQILSRVGATTLAVFLPGAFPDQPDEGAIVVPGTTGLVAMLVMNVFNAMLAGLLAGRIGRVLRVWHGVVLGAILGMFAAVSMDSLQGFPGWFALGYLVTPAAGASLGGWLASRVGPAESTNMVVERVPTSSRQSDDS